MLKALIVDRDMPTAEMIAETLAKHGVECVIEPLKNAAFERMRSEDFDAIFIDPAPQADVRPMIIGMRRGNKNYPSIILTGHTMSQASAHGFGANDGLAKPLAEDKVVEAMFNCARVRALYRQFGDESTDYPSRDGIIAKSAFNQLFITCLDRADRYGEKSFLINVTISNFGQIKGECGGDKANEICDSLKKYIARIRRLSDIIGQTADHEFTVMMLRPAREDEPMMAVNRFANEFREVHDLISTTSIPVELDISLLCLPSGVIVEKHLVNDTNQDG